jgi:hypothetical protein
MSADCQANALVEQIQLWCEPISPKMQAYFAPAIGCLYEWRDYWVEHLRPPGERSE